MSSDPSQLTSDVSSVKNDAGGASSEESITHLAIIMDGNGRWAKRRGKSASYGHRAGVEAVRGVLEMCLDRNVKILTLYAFSSENWQRPSVEVNALMTIFSSYLKKEVSKLHDDGVRIRFIGGRDRFSKSLLKQMQHAEQLTENNNDTQLIIAVDYGGRGDIVQAARNIALQVQIGELQPADIDEDLVDRYMSLADLPKPDLCIRTAGEYRISNFMLWHFAYTELFFTDTLWPDFCRADFDRALDSFYNRVRRYGGREEDFSSDPLVQQPTVEVE